MLDIQTKISMILEATKDIKMPEFPLPGAKPEPEKPKPKGGFLDTLEKMKDIAASVDDSFLHNKEDAGKWTDAQKRAACPRNGGMSYGIIIDIKHGIMRQPRYCNQCDGCFRAKAKELKERIEYIDALAKHNTDNGGHWRKKIVEEDKEAKALKKRISRNQDGRHQEFAADIPGHNEVWCYVDNDTENPEDYGEAANIEDIDAEKVYRNNRSTGKKFSTGKAFKSSAPSTKEETIRVHTPEIIVFGGPEQAEKAEQIASAVHPDKEAETAERAIELHAARFKMILRELEKQDIEIAAIKMHFRNYTPDDILEAWNSNVKYWRLLNKDDVSIFAPLDSKGYGANMDTEAFKQ